MANEPQYYRTDPDEDYGAEITNLTEDECQNLRENQRTILRYGATSVGVTDTPDENSVTIVAPSEDKRDQAVNKVQELLN